MSVIRTIRRKVSRELTKVLRCLLTPVILGILNEEVRLWGDPARLTIAPTVGVQVIHRAGGGVFR